MAKINSNQKGKVGEREVAEFLRSYGFEDARRSQQYAGINNDADVVGLPHAHVEVKRVERLNISKAVQQCMRDKRADEYGTVFHRRNHEKWKVTMDADEFMEVYKKALIVMEEGE